MIGAGTFINPLLKIVTTVAVLAAMYFFILKPILDTTEDAVNRAFDSTAPAIKEAERASRQARRQLRNAGAPPSQAPNVTRNTSINEAQKILRCIERANGDVNQISACNQP
jgi:hypothetical protein